MTTTTHTTIFLGADSASEITVRIHDLDHGAGTITAVDVGHAVTFHTAAMTPDELADFFDAAANAVRAKRAEYERRQAEQVLRPPDSGGAA